MTLFLVIVALLLLAYCGLKLYVSANFSEVKKEYRVAGYLINKLSVFSTEAEARKKNAPARNVNKKPGRHKDIRISEHIFDREDGKRGRVIVYAPNQISANDAPRTGIFWVHGGGYLGGSPASETTMAKLFVLETNSVVVSPEYTLSTVAPYPAGFDDAWACLLWMKEHAEMLGINPHQLFIGGGSAGGGLVAALCLKARDTGAVQLAFQIPIYPMINDKMDTESAKNNHAFLWNSVTNEIAWKMYLGDLYGTDMVPKYAAAIRETDFSNLPPAYTYAGTLDPFYDDTVRYIQLLQKEGIPAKYDIYEGAYHGFDALNVWTHSVKECHKKLIQEFKYAQEHYHT